MVDTEVRGWGSMYNDFSSESTTFPLPTLGEQYLWFEDCDLEEKEDLNEPRSVRVILYHQNPLPRPLQSFFSHDNFPGVLILVESQPQIRQS